MIKLVLFLRLEPVFKTFTDGVASTPAFIHLISLKVFFYYISPIFYYFHHFVILCLNKIYIRI